MKLSILIKVISLFVFVSELTFPLKTFASLIDFETTHSGGVPSDNLVVELDHYFISDGVSVSFGFDTTDDGFPDSTGMFEEAAGGEEVVGGVKNSGFKSSYGSRYDIAATGYEALLGNYFFRQKEAYMPFGTFHIIYDAVDPVTAASGEIWDIDGKTGKTEQFYVEAFNGSVSLASIYSPLGISYGQNSLDGKPWVFGFNGLSNITRIEITFVGSKTQGIGLAFNNFSPLQDVRVPLSTVPEPATFAIVTLGLLGLACRRFKK